MHTPSAAEPAATPQARRPKSESIDLRLDAGGWTPVTNRAIALLPQIGTVAFAVLALLSRLFNRDGVCWPSMATIAAAVGVTTKSARKAVSVLSDWKLIIVEARKGPDGLNRSNVYRRPKAPPKGTEIKDSTEKNDRTGVSFRGYGSKRPTDQEPITNNNTSLVASEPKSKSKSAKKAARSKFKLAYSEDDMSVAEFIWAGVLRLNPNHSLPNLENWANEIRKMAKDGPDRTHEGIRELFDWANRDSFWQSNVLCPTKLRKQWDTLATKRRLSGKKNGLAHASENFKFPSLAERKQNYRGETGLALHAEATT